MILQGILLVIGGILALLLFLIVLLTAVPLTVLFEYVEAGFLIELRVLFLKFPLLRRETQEEKKARLAKKEAKSAKKKQLEVTQETKAEEKKKTDYRKLLNLILKVLEEFSRKEKIPLNNLWLDVTVGGEDPATTGILFGSAHGLLGALWPLVERFFYVKDRQIRTAVDFTIPAPRVDYFYAILPLPLLKVLGVALRLLLGHIKERSATQKAESKQQSNEQREAA